MSTIVTRSGKGSPLTHNEVDTNFTNLNTDKVEKTAADITGGTINNTTIGATTPSTGVFTTLGATGQTSLGGVAGSESLRVLTPTLAGNYAQINTNNFGDVIYGNAGSGTNIPNIFLTKGTGVHKFATNNSVSNTQAQVSHTASAVNYVQVTGAATGNSPLISAQGSDANRGLTLSTKGTHDIILTTGGTAGWIRGQISAGSGEYFRAQSSSATPVNYTLLTGTATGISPSFSVAGSDTNISLVLQPKGTGALQAQQTDSTATGGNARGANAVDWQTSRSTAAQVASGQYSAIVGGSSNTANNSFAFVGSGALNSASGFSSFVGGGRSNTAGGTPDYGTIVAGLSNTSAGFFNFIGGGFTNSGTSGSAVTTQSGTMNATTAVTLSGSNANIKVGQLVTGTSIAGYTYVAAISGTSLTLSQAASGSSTSTLSFFTPHGVVVGGGNNQATGSYSYIGGGGDAGTAANRNVASGDWSTVAGGLKNVASNTYVTIGGGQNNTASNSYACVAGGVQNNNNGYGATISGGYNNSANQTFATVVGGSFGNTRGITGSIVFPACDSPIVGVSGATQAALLIIAAQTTDATPVLLTANSVKTGNTGNQVILPNNSAYYFKVEIIANVTGGGNTSGWELKGVIKRGANAASTAIVGSVTSTLIAQDAGASTWVVSATADTTNGGLKITVTGQASTTIRWVAKASTTEVTF